MKYLDELIEIAQNNEHGSLFITKDENKNYYQSIRNYIEDIKHFGRDEIITEEELLELEKNNRIWEVQYYPNTAHSFYKTIHWDLNEACRKIIDTIKEKRNER